MDFAIYETQCSIDCCMGGNYWNPYIYNASSFYIMSYIFAGERERVCVCEGRNPQGPGPRFGSDLGPHIGLEMNWDGLSNLEGLREMAQDRSSNKRTGDRATWHPWQRRPRP